MTGGGKTWIGVLLRLNRYKLGNIPCTCKYFSPESDAENFSNAIHPVRSTCEIVVLSRTSVLSFYMLRTCKSLKSELLPRKLFKCFSPCMSTHATEV